LAIASGCSTASATAAPSVPRREYITLADYLVTPLPEDVSFAAGATLGIPCMTAWCCLFCDGPIMGQTVLVTGGAGAVGHYAVQLAKWGGARVIATVSSTVKDMEARLAGADIVVKLPDRGCGCEGDGFHRKPRRRTGLVDVDFGGNIATTLKLNGHEFDDCGLRHQRQSPRLSSRCAI